MARIDRIEVYYVVLPLIYPWRTAYGEDADIHSILIRMVSGEHEGWGETCPFYAPTYSPETATSAFFLISEIFAPMLVGQDIASADELLERIQLFKGNPFAKGGIESAWWLLEANIQGQPLHTLLGGNATKVDAGADCGIVDSYDMLLGQIQDAHDKGFKRLKLKVRPGWDFEMLKIVRAAFPNLTTHIDCNSGYTLNDLPFFKEVDKLGLAMIEQPLFHTDLHDHAELQRQIQTPICLDESIKSERDFDLALKLGSCRILNIKYARVGGLSVSKRLHDRAQNAGIQCWVGGMLESAIGAGISIELATLPNFTYPNDLFESARFYRQEITEPATHINADCTFSTSTVPGIPYQPVMERVNKVTKQRAIIAKEGIR